MDNMKYIILVTHEDGTETAYGVVSPGVVDERTKDATLGFEDCYVRSVSLLNMRTMYDDIQGNAN